MSVQALEDTIDFTAAALVALGRIAEASERIADALEQMLQPDELVTEPPDVPGPTLRKGERDPYAPWTDEEEEAHAAIEILEEAGVDVPADAYKRLGLDPPKREDEPTEDEMEAPQPGAEAEAGDGGHDG